MSILVYCPGKLDTARRLQIKIKEKLWANDLERCQTFESLCNSLKKPGHTVDIAVVMATDRQELQKILSIEELFSDIRIILILKDKNKDTISMAHALGPRFISFADSDFEDVMAVTEKMCQKIV
jgi:hypothetical protein